MYVYWKPLILLGFLFWIVLLSADVFRLQKNFETAMPEPHTSPPPKKGIIEVNKSTSTVQLEVASSDKLSADLGLTMILINIVLFVVSIIFCAIAKFVATVICRYWRKSEKTLESEPEKVAPIEKLPIGDRLNDNETEETVKNKSRILKTTTSSNTELRLGSDQICQTIFHTSVPLKHDPALRMECSRLREELLTVQTNSIKEHAVLSRKLEALTKEKRDINKRLSVSLKENNTAKTQIEELMEEKKNLHKRLESASKDARLNAKTKKIALAKLEEISASVEDLKGQLEQVTRDKNILQGKLNVMRNEYEKIQERLRLMQIKETNRINADISINKEVAEKDENGTENSKEVINEDQSFADSSQSSLNQIISKESVFLPYVISQTEIDMKNIQMKILQLEKSMKEFGSRTDVLEEVSKFENETERNLLETINKSSEEAEKLDDRLGNVLAKMKATREDLTCKKTYDEIKVNMLRNALKEKIRVLEHIKEKEDESSPTASPSEATTIDDEEFEMSSEEASSPRFLSNSTAFQRFLKNIGAEATLVNIGDKKCENDLK